MATAQILKLAHTVDENVRDVRDEVLVVDNRVAGVDKKVAALIDGAQYTFNQLLKSV